MTSYTGGSELGSCTSAEGSSEISDAGSRNANFMLCLMDMCNKMTMPVAAMQQDFATDDDGADNSDSDIATSKLPSDESPEMAVPHSRSSYSSSCGVSAAKKAGKIPAAGPRLPHVAIRPLSGRHQRAAACGCSQSCGDRNNANQHSRVRPSKKQGHSTSQSVSAETISCLGGNAQLSHKRRETRPLLKNHSVPYWQLARFHEFRGAQWVAESQLYEPMLDTCIHRHLLILDNCQQLKVATEAAFRTSAYRPY